MGDRLWKWEEDIGSDLSHKMEGRSLNEDLAPTRALNEK